MDRVDHQTEVKIFSEAPGLDLGAQIAMRGAHHAHIDRDFRRAPTRRMVFSCSVRNRLACVIRLISPISSSKSVPPLACSKQRAASESRR